MLPVQNFNGYDHPWAGGNGTNQLDFDNATLTKGTASGTADNFTFSVTRSGTAGVFFSLPDSYAGKTMYLSGQIERTGTHANDIAVQLQRSISGASPTYNVEAGYTENAVTLEDVEVEFPANGSGFVLRIIAAASADDSTGETMTVTNLRLCDETGQAWSPYENICPIYGHTAALATRCARNFLENQCETHTFANGITVTVAEDGTFTFNGTLASNAVLYYNAQTGALTAGTQRDNVRHLQSGSYLISIEGDAGVRLQVVGYNFGGALDIIRVVDGGYTNTLTINEAYQCNFCRIYLAAGTYNNATAKIMIRLATDTDATYEPYNGDTYTVSFGRTIYGGTLDIVTGVLTETWGYIASYNGETLPAEWISDRDVYTAGTTPTTGAAVAYRLASPQTYQLTPKEITTLYGTNNVWVTTTTNRQ